MGLSWQHILLLMIVALLLFGGRGKISGLMGDFASGIKAFKKGLADDDSEKAETAKARPQAIDIKPQAADRRAAKKRADPRGGRRARVGAGSSRRTGGSRLRPRPAVRPVEREAPCST